MTSVRAIKRRTARNIAHRLVTGPAQHTRMSKTQIGALKAQTLDDIARRQQAQQVAVELRAELSWWLIPYMKLLLVLAAITGWKPSGRHLGRVTEKGLRLTANHQVPSSRLNRDAINSHSRNFA